MSTRVSRVASPRGTSHRKASLNLDLNVPVPQCDHSRDVGTSSHAPAAPQVQGGQQRVPPPPVMIDVESIDDDVIVSSPRAFAEAKKKSRRNRSRIDIVDVDLVETANRHAANNRNKRQRVPTNQPIINCESYVIPERNINKVIEKGRQTRSMALPSAPPPEPTFSCAVCMGPLVEEMSTKCGHIFCKACISKAIAAQGKCPTCRRKVTMKNTIRVYLPTTS